MNFIAIVGTNADFSYNRLLLQFMQKFFAKKARIDICELKELPAFNEDLSVNDQAGVLELAKKIEKSDGVIIAVPEYDHSIPAVLKSTLEWLSYQIKPLKQKAVFVVGTSYGPQGSARAQLHLRQILESPDIMANVLPGNEFLLGNAQQSFDDDADLKDESNKQMLTNCFDAFLEYANWLKKVK